MDDIYEAIVRWRREGRRGALATIVNARDSIPSFRAAKMLIGDDGAMLGTVGNGWVKLEVSQVARAVMEQEKPQTLTFNLNDNPKYHTGLVCSGTLEIFIEPLLPIAPVYVFGAGHVGFNVHTVARIAGFDVVVVDDCASFANLERFPDALEVYGEDLERVFGTLKVGPKSCIVIATRGRRDDMRVLRWAVGTPARYIGMLGSKREVLTICRELEKEGTPREVLERVHAPVGLDNGAASPEEIAVSIVAELISVRRQAGQPLAHMRQLPKPDRQEAPAAEVRGAPP